MIRVARESASVKRQYRSPPRKLGDMTSPHTCSPKASFRLLPHQPFSPFLLHTTIPHNISDSNIDGAYFSQDRYRIVLHPINQSLNQPQTCTAHTPCASRARQLRRKSRTLLLLLPPPSLVDSSARAVLVRDPIQSSHNSSIACAQSAYLMIQATLSVDLLLVPLAPISPRSFHSW